MASIISGKKKASAMANISKQEKSGLESIVDTNDFDDDILGCSINFNFYCQLQSEG
jgi:hypothetical protein